MLETAALNSALPSSVVRRSSSPGPSGLKTHKKIGESSEGKEEEKLLFYNKIPSIAVTHMTCDGYI